MAESCATSSCAVSFKSCFVKKVVSGAEEDCEGVVGWARGERERPTVRLKTDEVLVPLKPFMEAFRGLPRRSCVGGPTSRASALCLQTDCQSRYCCRQTLRRSLRRALRISLVASGLGLTGCLFDTAREEGGRGRILLRRFQYGVPDLPLGGGLLRSLGPTLIPELKGGAVQGERWQLGWILLPVLETNLPFLNLGKLKRFPWRALSPSVGQ